MHMDDCREALLAAGFTEATVLKNHFYRRDTEWTAFAVNLKEEKDSLVIEYGWASTAFVRMDGPDALEHFGCTDINLHEQLRIPRSANPAPFAAQVRTLYTSHHGQEKETLLLAVQAKRKAFLASIGARLKPLIHIFGASGSGTTTLGQALAESLSLRHIDSDDYYWLPVDPPFTQKRPVPERLALMQRDIDASAGAVISGSLVDWGDPLMPQFTLAIRVVTETPLRLERLHARELARFGERILPGGDMHGAHQLFLDWAARYDSGDASMRSRLNHDRWQQKLTCPLLVLDGGAPLEELLAQATFASSLDGQGTPTMTQLERIAAMEAALDASVPAVEALAAALDAYEAVRPQLRALAAYLDSGAWLGDYQDDEAGKIPRDMKRGVLSQDTLYDLLCDDLRLLRRMKALAAEENQA